MAKKISELNELLVPEDQDVFPIVEESSDETKKISYSSLKSKITEENSQDIASLQSGVTSINNSISSLNQTTSSIISLNEGFDKLVDMSVNRAGHYVDCENKLNFYNYIRTNTSGNFNGGGLGNKLLMGLRGTQYHDLPLANAPTFEFVADIKQGTLHPYIQLLVKLNPSDLEPKIFSLDSNLGSPIYNNVLKRTSLGGTRYKYEWDISQNYTYIVNGIVGAVDGVDYLNTGGSGWTFQAYFPSQLFINYPNAKLVNAIITDGGAPKSKLLSSIYFGVGDSSTNTYQHKIIEYIKINGQYLVGGP